MSGLLVFSDLDGTLLDHDSYSFAAAAPALAEIRRRAIPLVLASSKTRVEMLEWQARLRISDPFICENGAAICTPNRSGLVVEALAPPRDQVLAVLASLREEGFSFTGFADMTADVIADLTGLGPVQAARAASREYSEPLLWQDSEEQLDAFREALARCSMRALQGGRFLSVAGYSDKGLAMQQLCARYAAGGAPRTIALGDSPNDEAMLVRADIAVVICPKRASPLQLSGTGRVIYTEQSGAAGWQEAMGALLASELISEGKKHG